MNLNFAAQAVKDQNVIPLGEVQDFKEHPFGQSNRSKITYWAVQEPLKRYEALVIGEEMLQLFRALNEGEVGIPQSPKLVNHI